MLSPRKVSAFTPSMKTGAAGASPVPGRLMPMSACLLSPGPLTMQPMTATFIFSTPGLRCQRDADRVADPFLQQDRERRRRRDRSLGAHARLGQAEMERIVAALR